MALCYSGVMYEALAIKHSSARSRRKRVIAPFVVGTLALPWTVAAMAQPATQAGEDQVFVEQAPARAEAEDPARQSGASRPSPVYFPDAITPEASIAARERRAAQDQIGAQDTSGANAALPQVARDSEDGREVEQLSDGDGVRALAQLSEAEQQVLLEAVEGTDICERDPDVPAIRALCADRIETRSAEFAQDNRYKPSAEERLLGEGLDGDRAANLESAIARLARSGVEADDFSNQVIASVGLDNAQSGQGQQPSGEGDPASELSAETQALINAIVEQFGGNTGGQ